MNAKTIAAVSADDPWLLRPLTGNSLTIAAFLSFQFLCMILPLVGPSGAAAPHATKNFWAFLSVLLLTLLLGGLAVTSKLQRRQRDGSPLPWWTMGLIGVCLVILISLFMGLLSI